MTSDEFEAKAAGPFRSVFDSTEASEAPFTSRIERRAILYPVGYVLAKDEFQVLSATARTLGDTRMYVALLDEQGQPHYVVPLSFDDYASILINGETALYGPSGQWGLILSELGHGVVGGTEDFFEPLRRTFPALSPGRAPGETPRDPIPFDEQVMEFLHEGLRWGNREHVLTWLPQHLEHVYGKERASELLAEYEAAVK